MDINENTPASMAVIARASTRIPKSSPALGRQIRQGLFRPSFGGLMMGSTGKSRLHRLISLRPGNRVPETTFWLSRQADRLQK